MPQNFVVNFMRLYDFFVGFHCMVLVMLVCRFVFRSMSNI